MRNIVPRFAIVAAQGVDLRVYKTRVRRAEIEKIAAETGASATRTSHSVPRPRKRRILTRAPRPAIYKPAGVPLDGLRRVTLLHEELEALRLADAQGLTQDEAAQRMGVSRSTFQRIVTQARRQVALALIEGHALQIEGGTFEVSPPRPRDPRRRD
jgi:predicted DNA-binding protein (UPF0251 family)